MMNMNPFGVKNPEDMTPDYIYNYFVDVFTDFGKVRELENSFINGARGTGKSMMMRGLEAAVMLQQPMYRELSALPHVGIHVPLRRLDFSVPELSLPSGSFGIALAEHILVVYTGFRLAKGLQDILDDRNADDVSKFLQAFADLYEACGGMVGDKLPTPAMSVNARLDWLRIFFEMEFIKVRQYAKRGPFRELPDYNGALCGFLDFLLPLASRLQELPCMPKAPLFIMLDDADNLSLSMQRIVNSWVSTRSLKTICLKVTTQLGYGTYRTVDHRLIESPHDFSVIDIGSIYTNSRDRFAQRVREIVERRLQNAGIGVGADAFFPEDVKQAERLRQICEDIRKEALERKASLADGVRRGAARPGDDVSRYAVPRLMRELAGSSKSSHTFSYSGFNSLVNLSSGVIRWFLEPAARMFDDVTSETAAETAKAPVSYIPTAVQDRVIDKWSKEFAEALQLKSADDPDSEVPENASLHAGGHETEVAEKLHNLVTGLGRLFRARLMDANASEQRAFSVMVRGVIPKELDTVLSYGVRHGYLQRSDNAAKEADGGRVPRYILARRLGPYFRLDVSGYAAHLSVKAEELLVATRDPGAFVQRRQREKEYKQFELPINPGEPDA